MAASSVTSIKFFYVRRRSGVAESVGFGINMSRVRSPPRQSCVTTLGNLLAPDPGTLSFSEVTVLTAVTLRYFATQPRDPICNQYVESSISTKTKLRNNLGQFVHTCMRLSPSSITWYLSKDGDVLQLERWLQKVMAAYRRGWLKKSLEGWLPLHRDKLRAQRR